MRSRPTVSTKITKQQTPGFGVRGKFLFLGEEKFYVRGVTYGTFRPDARGDQYGSPETVAEDFAAMRKSGVNTVRTYTVPPRWLLDLAARHELYVMVGLPWEQHITFLDEPERAASIIGRVRSGVRACADHPAVLCFAVGNEIPASIVRWYGRRRIERFLQRLYFAAKEESPRSLITYVNYPTTEYLQLPFFDFICFNVFLESQDRLEAYLARLQNLVDERPLVLTEVGLDSRLNGEVEQARTLDWQIRTTFANGAAGVFLFSWTDEWYRGGYEIEDWDFGLTTRDRKPKQALAAVDRAFRDVPFSREREWPYISVVVCTYNGHRTIRECITHLCQLDYPNYEVIVVDDGSLQPIELPELPIRFVRVPNGGLSVARNIGLENARGEIVAYIDDDAYPDPHWLTYLAHTFLTTDFVAVGGPNLPPPGDGPLAEGVAHSPGGPAHVLLSDREAEHIPGCNMAFRKAALEAIDGFDPQFRIAGDDVDVCWRMQEQGWKLGFHPAAVVWHHRRNSVTAYWKQQVGYGRAEALLEKKWPAKYNVVGHPTWSGRVYGGGIIRPLGSQSRVYHGIWGTTAYQCLFEFPPGLLPQLLLLPEWGLIVMGLWFLAAIGLTWLPLLVVVPLAVLASGISLWQALQNACRTCHRRHRDGRWRHWSRRSLITVLHLVQPFARLWGRLQYGITPWRVRGVRSFWLPWPRSISVWDERWKSAEERLRAIEASLRRHGAVVLRGGEFDRWELEVQGGLLGAARMCLAIEEHGAGRQMLRFRVWPRLSRIGMFLTPMCASFAALALGEGANLAAALLGFATVLLLSRCLLDPSIGIASIQESVQQPAARVEAPASAPGAIAAEASTKMSNGLAVSRLKPPLPERIVHARLGFSSSAAAAFAGRGPHASQSSARTRRS